MLAVIKSGGKQYLVAPGDKIKVEKIEKKEGNEIIFDEVLLLEKGLQPTHHPRGPRRAGGWREGRSPAKGGPLKLEIGTPLVKGAKVIGKVLREGKGEKIIVFKYKPKTRYKVKKGHRQPFTEVEITKIESRI